MKNSVKKRKVMKRRKNRKIMVALLCSLLILGALSVMAVITAVKNKTLVQEGMAQNQFDESLHREKEALSREESLPQEKPLFQEAEDLSKGQETILEEEQTTSTEEEPDFETKAEEYLIGMSLEEKVAQLFIVTPESLMGVDNVTAAGENTKETFQQYPVGGFIYSRNNLLSSEQVTDMLVNIQKYSMERLRIPAFTCVDEEGGTVTRISGTGRFNVPVIEDMSVIGETKDVEKAYEIGDKIGTYLSELGFNIDFAPVADVLSNPENKVVKLRSFGGDPDLVADMSSAVCKGLQEHNVLSVLKHYPGHGATAGDSHQGYAYMTKTLEELEKCELVPFQRGIDDNISFIMAGHISVPNVTGEDTPASLSHMMVTEILREQMGYKGIVITDAMNMGAVTQHYSSAEAAVNALLAGVDIILMPEDFYAAYNGVLEAVGQGQISEERINESIKRILSVKLYLSLSESEK